MPPVPEVICTPAHTQADIACIAQLARQIWTEHYTPIIGAAQVEYMLANFQSEAAIARQIAGGHEYFILLADNTASNAQRTPLGYMDIVVQPESTKLFLSKLYVTAAARGRGFGRAMFDRAMFIARQRGLKTVWLTVNRFNPALQVYLQWGMKNKGPVVKDIGGGFVMDDFQLEKAV